MKKRIFNIVVAFGIFAMFCWASRMDWEDEMICEIQNAGLYEEISDTLGDGASNADIIKYYQGMKK